MQFTASQIVHLQYKPTNPTKQTSNYDGSRGETNSRGGGKHLGRGKRRGHIPIEPGPLPGALVDPRVREIGDPLGLHLQIEALIRSIRGRIGEQRRDREVKVGGNGVGGWEETLVVVPELRNPSPTIEANYS